MRKRVVQASEALPKMARRFEMEFDLWQSSLLALVAQGTSMTAKQRYDAKRKNDTARKQKEAERALTRWMTRRGLLTKTGFCQCGDCQADRLHHHAKRGKTVWHHLTYKMGESDVLELSYKCHRKAHPRPMPNGKVR